MTTRDEAGRLARVGQMLTVVGLLGLAGVFVRAVAFTPVERVQGPAQKIMYVHVPAAWCALMAISVTGVLSVFYLWLKDIRLDRAAAASAEVGVAFGAIMLTTGPMWGKPVWGTWWTWDARLTSTLFLFLLFVGYLLVRDSVEDPSVRARFCAVIGVLGLALVPFVHLTVYMFRTLHPQPVVLKPTGPTMPGSMVITLLLSVGVFTLLYASFVTQKYALSVLHDLREEERHRAA
jgi:heme exporter protein C